LCYFSNEPFLRLQIQLKTSKWQKVNHHYHGFVLCNANVEKNLITAMPLASKVSTIKLALSTRTTAAKSFLLQQWRSECGGGV